jgi:hypothetical protein
MVAVIGLRVYGIEGAVKMLEGEMVSSMTAQQRKNDAPSFFGALRQIYDKTI